MSVGGVSHTEPYQFFPTDIAFAFREVVKEQYGLDKIAGMKINRFYHKGILKNFFEERSSVNSVTIDIGPNEKGTGLFGPLTIEGVTGVFNVVPNGAPVIAVENAEKKDEEEIMELLKAVGEYLENHSIYRGKALVLDGGNLRFLDIEHVNEEGVVYNSRVYEDLEAHVWSLIEHMEMCERIGAPIQHKVLFKGKFGTGKTLAAALTARRAGNNEWGYLAVKPTSEKDIRTIKTAFEFAKKYQRIVVHLEDIDHEERHDNAWMYRQMLDIMDGVETKNIKMIVLMTTNYPDKIGNAMQRPGRIDKIIDFDKFNHQDIVRLLKKTIDPEFLDPNIDWKEVAQYCHDYTPAFVRVVGENAKLFAVREAARTGSDPRVTQENLIRVAEDLLTQHKACNREDIGFTKK